MSERDESGQDTVPNPYICSCCGEKKDMAGGSLCDRCFVECGDKQRCQP